MKPFLLIKIEKILGLYFSQIEKACQKVQTINLLNSIHLSSEDSLIDKDNEFIVSLTTFGKRINEVYLTIESIGRQTVKPGRIVLWLAEDEFSDEHLPVSLINLKKRGLEIGYCKDIKSYKKLIPSLEKFPDKLIITVDDDIIYGINFLEIMVQQSRLTPKQIICGVAKEIGFHKGKIQCYSKWKKNSTNSQKPSQKNIGIGYGGILYFPGCFDKEVFNTGSFMSLAPHADDLWFKVMSAKNGVKVRSIYHLLGNANTNVEIESAQDDSLYLINVVNGKNDEQFQALLKAYPELNFND